MTLIGENEEMLSESLSRRFTQGHWSFLGRDPRRNGTDGTHVNKTDGELTGESC